jgi:hypothetical protein
VVEASRSRPLVSVLVVTYGHEEEIASCIDAALRQRGDAHDLEVIVVDNASTDATVEVLARYADDVKLIGLPENVGYAEGVNTAFDASSGDVVVLLNPDCVMDDGCVEALWRHLASSAGVGVAAALLRNLDGTPQLFARRELTMPMVFFCMTEYGKKLDKKRGGKHLAHRRYEREFEGGVHEPLVVDCPAAACVASWRRLLEPRPLNPAYPLVFNDADLYRRLRTRAYRCEIVPTATAAHGYGTSLRRVVKPRMRAEFVASLRRYASPPWGRFRSSVLWLILVFDAVSSVLMKKRPNARGTLGGLGLPGGAQPWLSKVPGPKTRVKRSVRGLRPNPRQRLRRISRGYRRRAFITRLRWSAWLMRADLDLDVHRTADIARGTVFEVRPRSKVRVVIGPHAQVQEGGIWRLAGTFELGEYGQLRYGVNLNVKGALLFEGRNKISRGATIHCDGTMRWAWGASTSEYVTVIDNDHRVDGSPVHVHDHPNTTSDVTLGAGILIGAHSTVTSGVTIGQGTIVGANSVVTKDLPAGVIAIGTPAKPLRALPAAFSPPEGS